MPLYEYQCTECAKKTEVLQRFDDAPLAACPACGGTVKKLVSSPAFQFKGSGWYVTDYARKGGPGASAEAGGDQPAGAAGADGAAAAAEGATTKAGTPAAPAGTGQGADGARAAEAAAKPAGAGAGSKPAAKPAAKPVPAGGS